MRLLPSLMLLATLSGPLAAGDFDAVIASARQTWPERQTVVVICNKDASSMALMDLGSATEKVLSLIVADLSSTKDLEKVMSSILRKPKAEIFVLLISDDTLTGENTEGGRTLVARMTQRGVPVVGTTAKALKLGAVFAIGSGTGDKLQVNAEVAKKLGVALPEETVEAK